MEELLEPQQEEDVGLSRYLPETMFVKGQQGAVEAGFEWEDVEEMVVIKQEVGSDDEDDVVRCFGMQDGHWQSYQRDPQATGSSPPPQTSARRSGTTSGQQSHAAHPAGPRPEVIWNRSHPDHPVLAKRDEVFDEVTRELGMSMPELKQNGHQNQQHDRGLVEVKRMGSRVQEVKDK
ncbi:hypothetical protein quinque_001893 [Culex quinquefasciatus]